MQKLPKLPGFKSHRSVVETVYIHQLEQFDGKTVDAKMLADAKLISNPYVSVKVLVKGELTKKVSVKLPKASAQAIALIEAAGGNFESAPRIKRQTTKKDKTEAVDH